MSSTLRLAKLMADRGLCSRREAEDLIARGWVKVDGVVIQEQGSKVSDQVQIELSQNATRSLDESVTILLNKPIGFVSGQPEDNYQPAVQLITEANRDPNDKSKLSFSNRIFAGLAPAGRLDIDSQGLLVFTQSGVIAKRLVGENSNIEKEYLVRVRGTLSRENMSLLRHGLKMDGKALKACRVDWINQDQLKMILTEGKKRQIRRMCESVGLEVLGLKRVRIGKVVLGALPEGAWRFLAKGESF